MGNKGIRRRHPQDETWINDISWWKMSFYWDTAICTVRTVC